MRDRAIIVSLAIVGLLAAFYFMVLSPKREKASKLSSEITELQASIDQQEQLAAFGEQARAEFPRYYGRLVVLGKAVPEGADSASLIVQLNDVAQGSQTDLRSLALGEGGGAASTSTAGAAASTATAPSAGTSTTPSDGRATPSAGTSTTPSDGSTTSTTSTTPTDSTTPAPADGGATPNPTATTTPPPATEATAASLPIGATVGPAGLPVMPYNISLTGSYFDVADFMAGVDRLVHLNEGQVAADGRLLTVDGFSLTPIPNLGAGPQTLTAQFALTSYVTPAEQGLTGGATPGGPAPSPAQPSTTPTTTPVVSP